MTSTYSLGAAMAVPSYKNTGFAKWRRMFNAALNDMGQPVADEDTAKGFYQMGDSPMSAARYIANS